MKQLILLVALVAGLASCSTSDGDSNTIKNIDAFDLNRMKGKKTFIFFFLPTCGYCQQELPKVEELWKMLKSKNGKEIEFLAVTSNITGLDQQSHTMPIYIDTSYKLAQIYKPKATPTYYIVGQNGEIEWSHTGTTSATAQQLYNKMTAK